MTSKVSLHSLTKIPCRWIKYVHGLGDGEEICDARASLRHRIQPLQEGIAPLDHLTIKEVIRFCAYASEGYICDTITADSLVKATRNFFTTYTRATGQTIPVGDRLEVQHISRKKVMI